VLLIVSSTCAGAADDPLYGGFREPPAEARPFVRWWWNGNCVSEEEILRELDLMQAAGIGGIEINPIAMPAEAKETEHNALVWLSPEWNRLVKIAVDGARQRGMIADLIVGTGWPFGGKFLAPDETIQGITLAKRELAGPSVFKSTVQTLLKSPKTPYEVQDKPAPEFLFLWLLAEDAADVDAARDLMDRVGPDGAVQFEVPSGRHTLYIGTWQQSFRAVMWGAPGADGPVLDHYNRTSVTKYLNRMSDELGPVLGGRLGDGLRAMFCDSIELSGANWTGDLPSQFETRRGYALGAYLPLILDKDDPKDSSVLADRTRRARYDFSKTLVELFHERFITPFHQWCHDTGTLSRYQAYGHPWLMGMLDGYMAPDIPEGDTWLFSGWDPLDGIRYAVWNKYAASGAHLTGRSLVGCEAMTNTQGVFRATLEYIKQATDLSIITGINHFVLHGFNYSPPEAGFPGWVRYGTYFNEQNPWWPYFPKWADYCARLSWIFQQSQPRVQVAIFGPTADVWSRDGLDRGPFVYAPNYLHRMWQAIHQNGCSADYINRTVLENATFQGGKLRFGPMAYDALIVASVDTVELATAAALAGYARAGGKIAFIGEPPRRSAGLIGAEENDRKVVRAIADARQTDTGHVLQVDEPERDELLAWAGDLLTRLDLRPAVRFDPPRERIYQIHHRQGPRDIFFLANLHQTTTLSFDATFDVANKTPWRWDPETGTRSRYPYAGKRNRLEIELGPLESVLLVFEPGPYARSVEEEPRLDPLSYGTLSAPWDVTFRHGVNDEDFERRFTMLADLANMQDERLNTFAGTAIYRTEFDAGGADWAVLDLGRVHDVSEVRLNGRSLGVRWWGRHRYDVGDILHPGRNVLEVKVTTTVFNYCHSLADNPTAVRWTQGKPPVPTGLLGPVRLYKHR
jgi:hypothetical protein